MAKKVWNPGTAPTGVGGDTPYSANNNHQSNADELYAHCGADAEGNLPAAQPVNKGGTGATTAAAARTNLGLGTVAVENIVPVNKGGTGATTAAAARTNLGAVAVDYGWGMVAGVSGGSTVGIGDFLSQFNGHSQIFKRDDNNLGLGERYSAGMYVQAQDTFLALGSGYASGRVYYATGSMNNLATIRTGSLYNDAYNPCIGVGQTWTNVMASRALNTTYVNSSEKPIDIAVKFYDNKNNDMRIIVNGSNPVGAFGIGGYITLVATVPAGQSYSASGGTLDAWWELK